MLTELATPAGSLRREHRELEAQFVAALDPLLKLFRGASSSGRGEGDYTVRQLIARAMSDTIASLHLLTHGYLNQAYSTMRTAYEGLDLARLLAHDPAEAKRWVETNKGHRDFSPGAVRERLGEDRFDPVYSQLSELSHPRFLASKLTAFGMQKEGDTGMTVVIRVGPFMIDEAPDHWIAACFLGPLIGKIGVGFSDLVLRGAVAEADWDAAIVTSSAAIAAMGTLIASKVTEFGLDAEDLLQEFNRAPEIIAQANAEHPDE